VANYGNAKGTEVGFIAGTTPNMAQQWRIQTIGSLYILSPECAPTLVLDLNPTVNMLRLWNANGDGIGLSGGGCQLFRITIVDFSKTLSSISIASLPLRTSYVQGESLITKGLALTAIYSDNSTEVVLNGFTCSPTMFRNVGTQTVTVEYESMITTFTVTVNEKPPVTVSSISIASLPSKTRYVEGEALNTNGLTLTIKYSDNSSSAITNGFSCSPVILNNLGTQTITVTYMGKTTEFTVTVNPGVGTDMPQDAKTALNPFSDIYATDPYYSAVMFVYTRGLMIGMDNGRFAPNETLTREQAITIIARINGDDYLEYAGQTSFDDVDVNRWSSGAIAWAQAMGVTYGVGNNKFDPLSTVTYVQFEVMLMRHYRLQEQWIGISSPCTRANAAELLYSYV